MARSENVVRGIRSHDKSATTITYSMEDFPALLSFAYVCFSSNRFRRTSIKITDSLTFGFLDSLFFEFFN